MHVEILRELVTGRDVVENLEFCIERVSIGHLKGVERRPCGNLPEGLRALTLKEKPFHDAGAYC